MAEEENNDQSIADALKDESEDKAGGGAKKILRLLLPVGVVLIGVGAGNLVGRLGNSGSDIAEAATAQVEPDSATGQASGYAYFDLEPIIVNLNEPRLARYIRATLTLAVRSEDERVAKEAVEKKMPELKSWLILYLSDCSIEQVRGAANLNHVLRDIQDSFNEKLWPDSRPMIVRVSYKEWAVQ